MTTPGPSGRNDALVSGDLLVVLGIVSLAIGLVAVPSVRLTPLRIVVGGLLVFVTPGYALLAAIFPAGADWTSSDDGPDTAERLVLSVGFSIASVGLLTLALGLASVPLVPLVTVGIQGTITVAATAVALVRRWRLSPSEHPPLPANGWVARVRARLELLRSHPLDRTNVVPVVVALSAVVAAGALGVTMTRTTDGEAFTEFGLLTEQADGDLVASEYPVEFVRGESGPVTLAVANRENQAQSYTVVVQLAGQTITELDRFAVGPVPAGENVTLQRRVTPTKAGESLRLSFLLYRGDAPGNPTEDNAYREVHLQVDVNNSSDVTARQNANQRESSDE